MRRIKFSEILRDKQITLPEDQTVMINKKEKKRTCHLVDFVIPADCRVKIKENKRDKYLDLARELKSLWNMKVTVIPIVIGALGTVSKGLERGLEKLEIRRRSETIQTTTLLE